MRSAPVLGRPRLATPDWEDPSRMKRNAGNQDGVKDSEGRKLEDREQMLDDDALQETFPTSDPISVTTLDLNRT